MKKEIFKLQWPIAGPPLILIYNRNRTIMGQVPPDDVPKWLRDHLSKSLKDFFYATYNVKTTKIDIKGHAPWQLW